MTTSFPGLTDHQVNQAFGADNFVYGVQTPDIDLGKPDDCMPPPADLPQGDIGAELAALIVVSANQSKGAARQLQKSEEAIQAAAEKRQINAMHREAELKMAAGIVGIVGGVADGACAALGGDASTGAASGAAGWNRAGGDLKSIASGAGAMLDGEAVFKQADATQFEHEAATAKRGADSAKDAVDDAKKLADKAIDFYSQWTQGKAQASAAALHRS
jgi:hypothetical protein